jgi:predicted anti-sigma-YlaC factor YlaD
MDCIEIRAGFVGYIDGDLSGDEKLRVELHVAQCYDCREELDEMGRLLELSDAALKHPCPVDRFEDLKARLAEAEPAPIPMLPRPRLRVREALLKLAVAAVVIALIAASPFLIRGAKRLFTPIEGTTALGNGAAVKLPFRLPFVEKKLKMQNDVAEWATTGRDKEETDTSSSNQ